MIRRWGVEDSPAVEKIERLSFSDPWSLSMIEDCFLNPAFYGYVDEQDGVISGYVGVICAGDAEIALIAVDPSKRRSGIGKALLERAVTSAFDGGAENVFLEVRESNAPARALYGGAGFVSIAVRKKYYGDGEDAVVMVKTRKYAKEEQ